MASNDTLTVGFPLYEGCTLLDFGGATQVFTFAPGFKVVWLAAEDCPVRTTETVRVVPTCTFDQSPPLDIVFVPGGGPDVGAAMQDPTLVDFVRRAGLQAGRVGSICTGAFIVAAAGLFDGCQATTYWSQRENLALFPKVSVPEGYPRWVFDRDGTRFSGGGISSSIDLALELVHVIRGPQASQETQLSIQYAPAPPFSSGDPSQATPQVTARVLAGQKDFIETLREATLKVIGRS